jgi:hypothetical protein
MAYASRSGRARTSSTNPQAHAICDRCAFRYNHVDLRWQYDWAGAGLINKRILVCNTCYDEPQEQLRAIVVPADPVPILNARVEPYNWDSIDRRQVSGYNTVSPTTGIPIVQGDTRVTSLNDLPTVDIRVTQQTGEPPGGLNQLPGTDPNAVTFKNILNVQNNGIGAIQITVDSTEGMISGQQVTIAEVGGVTSANGNFTITVNNLTNFTLNAAIFSGFYTGGGYVINNPSLPYGFTQVPRTGPL